MDFIGDIDLMGLLSVIIFYFVILGVGMWAAQKKSNVEGVSEEVSTVHQADFGPRLVQYTKQISVRG